MEEGTMFMTQRPQSHFAVSTSR